MIKVLGLICFVVSMLSGQFAMHHHFYNKPKHECTIDKVIEEMLGASATPQDHFKAKFPIYRIINNVRNEMFNPKIDANAMPKVNK